MWYALGSSLIVVCGLGRSGNTLAVGLKCSKTLLVAVFCLKRIETATRVSRTHMNATETNTTVGQKQQGPIIGDFGAGKYSELMQSCFIDSQVIFRLSPEKADKLSRLIASDYGAAMKFAKVEASISKSVSKDGKVTLREAAKMKGVTITYPLTAMRMLAFALDAGKYHFLFQTTVWEVTEEMKKYFAGL